jgi:tetratricopeptide (TPR) repeat protein
VLREAQTVKRSEASEPTRGTRIVTWALAVLWLVLILFGIVSATDPDWLQGFSAGGVEVEARHARDAADALLRDGRVNQAIGLYEYVLGIKPEDVGTTVNLAVAYGRTGALDQAEALLRGALERGLGVRGTIAFNLADVLEKKGKTEEALAYFRKALGTAARQDQVHMRMGRLFLATEQYAEAQESFEAALRIQMDPASSYWRMLRRSLATYESDSTSLAIIEDLLATETDEADLSRYDTELLSRSQVTDKSLVRTHTCLGFTAARRGDPQGAISHFEKALEIDPTDREAAAYLREQRKILRGS